MKLGVSHRTPAHLNDHHLSYLAHLGVESLEVRILSHSASFDNIMRIKDRVETAGLALHEIMLNDIYSAPEICLNLAKRDETMALWRRFVTDLGRAGIGYTTYAWHTGGAYATGQTTTRGCPTRLFELAAAQAMDRAYEHDYSDEDMWQSYTRFINEILPVAEDAGVTLQLHPNDPPVSHQGVARIFRSTEAFRRALEISEHSPNAGILFCVGCWAEMVGPTGEGEDIVAAIREFGSQGHIHQVHFRNIDSHLPNFKETFPDEGYVDMPSIVKALAEVGYSGMLVPDHVPDTSASEGGRNTAEAFVFGYIRGLLQSVQSLAKAA
jgi:mannonate dehydratase